MNPPNCDCLSFSHHAQPSPVLGRTHSERWGLWKSLSWHDHTQDDMCWIYGWRQRCLQCENHGKWKNKSVCTSLHSFRLFDRETPAAPWCVLEKSMDWCRGVRDVPFPTIPESTSKSVSSSTGLKMSYEPTLKDPSIFTLFSPFSMFLFFSGNLFKFPLHKNTACVPKCRQIK